VVARFVTGGCDAAPAGGASVTGTGTSGAECSDPIEEGPGGRFTYGGIAAEACLTADEARSSASWTVCTVSVPLWIWRAPHTHISSDG